MALKDSMVWFKANFGARIVAATAGTPFDLDMLTAVAVQETGSIWGRLYNKGLTQERILELCVGDVINAPKRKAFPVDRAALVAAPRGSEMHMIARAGLADMAAFLPEYAVYVSNPERFCHGYGLFQYDIQFFKEDPDYFLERRYIHFDQTLGKAISELTAKLKSLGPKLGWAPDRKLNDADKAALAIAYNTGSYNPAKALKQGYQDPKTKKFYGEYFAEYMALAKTIPLPVEATPAPTPKPSPTPVPTPKPSPTPSGGEAMLVNVSADPLNVRRTPEKVAGNVFKQLSNKQPVTAFESKNGFRHIKAMLGTEAVDGWVSADFLKPVPVPAPPPPPPAPVGDAMVVDVASDPLNVRREPKQVDGNVVAKLPDGHPVRGFESKDGYRHVRTMLAGTAVDGWASAKFLKGV